MVNLRTFDLNLLRIFEVLSHHRSVSKAAETLGLTQSAVSNALNRLRHQLDDPLFVRTRFGMEPTPKAEELAETLHEGLATIWAGLNSSNEFDLSSTERRFTLVMTDVGITLFLPILLRQLRDYDSRIRLRVLTPNIDQYDYLLESGIADLAISRIKLSDSLHSELIHRSPFAVLASCENPFVSSDWTGAPSITLENYLNAPHINLEMSSAWGQPVLQALSARKLERNVVLEVLNAAVLPAVMEGTDLLATIPKIHADKLAKSGSLVCAAPPIEIEPNLVYQWWHRRNDGDAGHRWLRELFASAEV